MRVIKRPGKFVFFLLIAFAFLGHQLIGINSPLYTLLMTVFPVIFLGVAIYLEDDNPEPFKTIMKIFAAGFLTIPLTLLLHWLFSFFIDLETTPFRNAYLGAGMVEELAKWTIFMLFVTKQKDFDEPFDAVVYAAIIALSFACLENFLYVFGSENGIEIAYSRAVFAVPGHFFDGIIMGYFLAKAFFKDSLLKPLYFILSLIAPMLAHGTYDFILMSNEETNEALSVFLIIGFLWFDYKLWGVAVKLLGKLRQDNKAFHDKILEMEELALAEEAEEENSTNSEEVLSYTEGQGDEEKKSDEDFVIDSKGEDEEEGLSQPFNEASKTISTEEGSKRESEIF
ncbi:MAG: PrsW family glutamic-type intramembrane protease [Paludibacteraceae bacterium]|nr:PrsW family glutamic-type intramembrane protease [Paludibacteraceae bacterium]